MKQLTIHKPREPKAHVCQHEDTLFLRGLGHRNTAHDERKESTLQLAVSTY